MEKKKEIAGILFYSIAVFIGITCFITVYGVKVLNPGYDDWLLRGGDLTQHYIGWEFFRTSEWHFPVGLMDNIAYPNQVSVIFTDSIPGFALLFKLLAPVLPETFQYFGWWELLCFILQAVLAATILYGLTGKKAVALAGSLFFVMSPIFLDRVFYHTALSGQWLLLLAFRMGKQHWRRERKMSETVLSWGILGVLCGLVHMYYIPMCCIIMLGFLLAGLLRDRKALPLLAAIGAYIFGAGSSVFILGGFSHEHQLDAGGLGQFSFNLNGFFNSMGWSKFFPALQVYGEGGEEGFAYLGLGMFLVIFLDIILFGLSFLRGRVNFKRKEERTVKGEERDSYILVAYGFICIVCILASASHMIAFDKNHVFIAPYPQKLVSLWGMFRSSGRFIWPVYYLVFLYAIVWLSRYLKNSVRLFFIIFGIFLLQIYDISPVLQAKRMEYAQNVVYESKVQDEMWEELAKGRKHVVFASNVPENQDILYSISQYAWNHGMTVNDFYFAHSAAAGDIQESREESMADLRADTLYIFKLKDEAICGEYALEYQILDEIIVGVVGEVLR